MVTDGPVGLKRRPWGVVLVLVAVVAGGLATVVWSQPVRTSGGAICGSAWHDRPGHGSPSGGLRTAGDAARATNECRRAAAVGFWAGTALVGVAVAALLGTAVIAAQYQPGDA